MTVKRIIIRDGWRLERVGERIEIARSEHSDWTDVSVRDVEQLVADLRSLAQPEPIPEALDRD